jgi:hypothetical protein
MRSFSLISVYLASHAAATPLLRTRALGNGLKALLFDSPAAASDSGTIVSAEVFVFTPSDSTSGLKTALSVLTAPLKLAGIDVDTDTAIDRLQFFAATPENSQKITLSADGCASKAALDATDKTGLLFQNVDLGKCGSGASFTGKAADVSADAATPMTVFPSPDSGFGVISGTAFCSVPSATVLTTPSQTSTTPRRSATSCTRSS